MRKLFSHKKCNTFCIILILAIGFFIRFFPEFQFFKEKPAPISTPDSHYHTRRVIIGVLHYPNIPKFDSYISYPDGAYCIWPPLFDFLSASIIYGIFFGKPTVKQIEWGCAVYPIIYGLIIIILVYLAGKKLTDDKIGILAALFSSILPGLVFWSELSYNDHHIAESFVLLIIFLILIYNEKKKLIDWLLLGITFGTGMLLWQGAIIFVGMAFLILVLFLNSDSFLSFLIAMLMILPFSINTHYPDSPFSYRGLSLLHISMLALAILIMLAIKFLRKMPVLSVVSLLAVLLICLMLLNNKAFIGGLQFLKKGDPWLANIVEFQPLITGAGYLQTLTSNILYGRAYYVWPLILIAFFIENRNWRIKIFLILTIFSGILAFTSRRYSPWFTPFYAILLAYILVRCYRLICNLTKKPIWGHISSLLLFAVICQPCVLKLFDQSRWILTSVSPEEIAAFQWLNDSTPQTSHYLNPVCKPEYGVMCFWGDGHQILYYSHRPVAASNFGNDVPNFRITNELFVSENTNFVYEILNRLNCKYIYIKDGLYVLKNACNNLGLNEENYLHHYLTTTREGLPATILMPTGKGLLSTAVRLYYDYGNSLYLSGTFYPPFRHLRLRFASVHSKVKIFEYVKGAILYGRTQKISPIKLSLNIRINNCNFTYFDSLCSDGNGIYSITLPYPSDSVNPYIFESVKGKRKLIISEQNVSQGDTIYLEDKEKSTNCE